jgi:hypothetical protein
MERQRLPKDRRLRIRKELLPGLSAILRLPMRALIRDDIRALRIPGMHRDLQHLALGHGRHALPVLARVGRPPDAVVARVLEQQHVRVVEVLHVQRHEVEALAVHPGLVFLALRAGRAEQQQR